MNSKIFFSGLLVFILSSSNLVFGQCWSMTLVTQSQIDNFSTNHPDCLEINGTLRIEENVSGAISNLNGLAQITKVEQLRIQYNTALTNLNGLNNLTTVSDGNTVGRVVIKNNQNLQNLDGLENLQEITQSLWISENPMLTSIEGLGNLSSTTLDISIDNNPSLISLSGLTNLSILKGLVISNNEILSNLNGLNNITEVSGLDIFENQNLINLQGLNNLITIGEGGADIYANPSLESFDGFENLVSCNWHFLINNNAAITNIEGFTSLASTLGIFSISNSPLLTSLDGLQNLTNVYALGFDDNNSLIDISALSNVDINTLYQLFIYDNPELAICSYPNICQYLDIPSNDASIYDNATGCSTRPEILQACGLIGIDENISLENFSIHPNPTNGIFTISGIDEGIIQITDSRGRILKTFTLGKDETSLNDLAEGIYFVNISNKEGSTTKRLLKI